MQDPQLPLMKFFMSSAKHRHKRKRYEINKLTIFLNEHCFYLLGEENHHPFPTYKQMSGVLKDDYVMEDRIK